MLIFNNYEEFYNALGSFDCKDCHTVQFFINAVNNSKGCGCSSRKLAARDRYQNIPQDIIPEEREKLLKFLNVEKIELHSDNNWTAIL